MEKLRVFLNPLIVLSLFFLGFALYYIIYPGPEGWGFFAGLYTIVILTWPPLVINGLINYFIKDRTINMILKTVISISAFIAFAKFINWI